uniref:Uncharacterized protein n=2 Tax=Aegilops tauschii subsp. strangulata TaxID=200361 RepID=A0A453P9W6_AEGTS
MLDLQCVRTTVIGLETVVLRLCLEMLIHYPSSIFCKCVQRTMKLRNYRKNQELWLLYRGFFVEVNMFKGNNKMPAELSEDVHTYTEKYRWCFGFN